MNNDQYYSEFEDEKTLSYFNRMNMNKPQKTHKSCSLVIIDHDRMIKTVELSGDSVTIGKNADIKINSGIVSRIHGRFTKVMGEYYYNDEGSLNGSELNGVKISAGYRVPSNGYLLGNGDAIRVMVPGDTTNPENTLIIFSTKPVSSLKWSHFDLRTMTTPLQIGRMVPPDHLKIDSMQVSKLHATIYYSQEGLVLKDENSLNGIFVNGQRIVGYTILKDFDVIGIGGTKLIFLSGFIYYSSKPNGIKLEVKDISKVVSGGKTILNNVTLTINPCELVAIIGTSGAGKTTFVNCINGYEPATSGQVIVDGLDLYKNYKYLKSRIGNVPQKDDLYEYLSVYNFLNFTAKLRLSTDISKEERMQRVDTVLEIMGLTEHKSKLIKKLSGGQKKRVSIAMELVADPDIFFLDEPTSGLDPETETQLMHQLKNLSFRIGKTVIVITHTLQNIHLFDKIIFLAAGGYLCFYGSPAEALEFFEIKTIPEAYEKVKNNAAFYIDKYQKMRRS